MTAGPERPVDLWHCTLDDFRPVDSAHQAPHPRAVPGPRCPAPDPWGRARRRRGRTGEIGPADGERRQHGLDHFAAAIDKCGLMPLPARDVRPAIVPPVGVHHLPQEPAPELTHGGAHRPSSSGWPSPGSPRTAARGASYGRLRVLPDRRRLPPGQPSAPRTRPLVHSFTRPLTAPLSRTQDQSQAVSALGPRARRRWSALQSF